MKKISKFISVFLILTALIATCSPFASAAWKKEILSESTYACVIKHSIEREIDNDEYSLKVWYAYNSLGDLVGIAKIKASTTVGKILNVTYSNKKNGDFMVYSFDVKSDRDWVDKDVHYLTSDMIALKYEIAE